ncbi:thioesterase domain-containing protein [Rhodococcus sp. ARC_M5]|uniref:thioesterase domain-containing protein n=1 Tax=Rhodococcus sp. ARC_M5 TaxID=2928851 RepID=UPI001FB48F98|nr:thioesterase domain-containing protein [Rhodococcus sp. ARC_M5]MCJ0892573.1 thioesterase domain-containing protein [Rhodococcus sp. ARC_M5]
MTVVNDLPHLALAELDPSNYAVPTIAPIRTTGHLDPVFCVHPLVGLVDCYAGLAGHIDDERPIYGVQVPTSGERSESLVSLASRYADDIARIQTDGAVHLLGMSFGGVLAHAIAVELQSRGVTVGALTLLDSDPVRARAEGADLLASMGDEIDRSHVEELLAVASHNDGLVQRHLPGIYFGDILAVSSLGTDSGSAWHPFVCGTVAKYLVPDATSFDVVGPLVDSYLS